MASPPLLSGAPDANGSEERSEVAESIGNDGPDDSEPAEGSFASQIALAASRRSARVSSRVSSSVSVEVGRARPSGSSTDSFSAQLERQFAQQRKASEQGRPRATPHCDFCGLEATGNVVECSSCSKCYHARCLTKRQAARFKGRGWQCDACLSDGIRDAPRDAPRDAAVGPAGAPAEPEPAHSDEDLRDEDLGGVEDYEEQSTDSEDGLGI